MGAHYLSGSSFFLTIQWHGHTKSMDYSSSLLQAQKNMQQARDEISSLCGSVGDGYVVDVLVSCEGTWQRQGRLHSLELCYHCLRDRKNLMKF